MKSSQSSQAERLPSDKQKHKKDTSNEIKFFWKSLSNKMNGKGKERDTRDNSSDASLSGRAATMGRTASMDASRRSLSAYPRHSSDHRASTSSTSFGSLHDIPETSQIPISSAGMVKSQSGPDVYGIATSAPLSSVPLSYRSQSAGPSTQYMQKDAPYPSSRKSAGLGLEDQLDEEAEDEWIGHESFTHDLSKRRRLGGGGAARSSGNKPSIARLNRQAGNTGGRTTPKGLLEEEEETEEQDLELSDSETEETSEIASQLSFVDTADLPLEEEDAEARESLLPTGTSVAQRNGTIRRVTSPLLTPTHAGPSMLERNRKNSSRIRYPSAISTAPASRHNSPQPSPISSTAPIDRIASDGTAASATRRAFPSGSSRPSESADSGTGMLTPTSPAPMRTPTGLSPTSTRPRSFSESAAGKNAALVGAGVGSSGTTSPRKPRSREPSSTRGSGESDTPNIRSRSGSSSNHLRELAVSTLLYFFSAQKKLPVNY